MIMTEEKEVINNAKKEAQRAATYMAKRMSAVWGMPEMQYHNRQALFDGCVKICKNTIEQMEGKIDYEKVAEAQKCRERASKATRKKSVATYCYLYAKGEMRKYLCNMSKHSFEGSTEYYFEHLIKAHKKDGQDKEPVCHKDVEDVAVLIERSDTSAKKLMMVYNTLGANYIPVYRDIKNSTEYKRVVKKHEKRMDRISALTLHTETVKRKQNEEEKAFEEACEALIARNELAKSIRSMYLTQMQA